MRVIRAAGLDFDDRFGLSGGSDTLFTRQLVASGARMVWCDEAVVTDVVPAARATRDWVLRRRLRFGNTTSRVELVLAGSAAARLRVRARLVGRGLARVGRRRGPARRSAPSAADVGAPGERRAHAGPRPRHAVRRGRPHLRGVQAHMTVLGDAAARGTGVTLAVQALRFLVQTASLIVLARLLTPTDFGIVAMVTAVAGDRRPGP